MGISSDRGRTHARHRRSLATMAAKQRSGTGGTGARWGGGMGIGLVFGVAFGTVLDDLGVGVAIGIALGVAFGEFAAAGGRGRDRG